MITELLPSFGEAMNPQKVLIDFGSESLGFSNPTRISRLVMGEAVAEAAVKLFR